jgi:hypothetical protein
MSNSIAKYEPRPDKSAAKRATHQQSQDVIRHHEDASHHKGTQHGGADSTRQQTLGSSKGTDVIAQVTSKFPAGTHPKGNKTTHKGGPSK